MNRYLVVWHNHTMMQYKELYAIDVKEATEKAYDMICENAGDRLYNYKIYRLMREEKMNGVINPKGAFGKQ